MNIMDLFRGQQQQSPAPAPNTQQQQQTPANQIDPNPAAIQQNGQPAPKVADPNAPKDPLADFASLFTMTEEDRKRMEEQNKEPEFFNLDPTKLQEQVKGMNFLDPNEAAPLMQAALKGDSQALLQLMNMQGQAVFHRAAMLSANLSNKSAKASVETVSSKMPEMFRTQATQQAVTKLNPVFNAPAARPIVEALRAQVATKYPDSSPDEIADMVNKYLTNLSAAVSPQGKQQQNGRGAPEDQDFSGFFQQ